MGQQCSDDYQAYTKLHLFIQISFASFIGLQILILLLMKGWAGLFLAFCPRKLVACKRTCAKKRPPISAAKFDSINRQSDDYDGVPDR